MALFIALILNRYLSQSITKYILNTITGELHRISSWEDFLASHNLANTNLSKFVEITNFLEVIGKDFSNGTSRPVYDIETGNLIAYYKLNRCLYCFR